MPQMKETPLIRCAHNGHYNAVQYLVEQGADVNAIDLVSKAFLLLGWAPLQIPALRNEHPCCMRRLACAPLAHG